MRRIYWIILLFLFNVGYIKAQGWYVYDGSFIPQGFDGWYSSTVAPGSNFVEQIVNNPFTGNKMLMYVQPDNLSLSDPFKNASKYYKLNFSDNNPGITILARLKGFPIDSLPEACLFNIEYSDKTYSVRDNLMIIPHDSIVKLERSNVKIKVNSDLNKWHIYRISFSAKDSISNIYMDENPTAILTGKSTATNVLGQNYIRMGDGGTPKIAGYVDWVIIDTTGIYSPGTGAEIPADLSTEVNVSDLPGLGRRVAFLTDTALKATEGYYADSNYVRDLVAQGFIVDVVPREYVSSQSNELILKVHMSDLVIIGCGSNSSDFGDGMDIFWKKLKKPIIILKNYIARSNKLGLLPTSSSLNASRFGTLEGEIKNPLDPAFNNMALPANNILPYANSNIGLLTFTPDQLSRINGEIIMTLANGPQAYLVSTSSNTILDTVQLSEYNGTPLMIRFAPLDSTYSGSDGGYMPSYPLHWRTFIAGGNDNDWDTVNSLRKRAYYVHTPEMINVLVNEILYLVSLPTPNYNDDAALSSLTPSIGNLEPVFNPIISSYSLIVPHGTESVTFSAIPRYTGAIVKGTNEFKVIPGIDTITVESQAGSLRYYIISIEEQEIAGNIVPPGYGTLESYVESANDGDTLFLMNDSLYIPTNEIIINKHLVIRAVEIPKLPELSHMPIIRNELGITDMIHMTDGGNLEILGVDLDGYDQANRIISLRSKNAEFQMYINRCRLHNVYGDIIGGNKTDSACVSNFYIRNSFVYNAGLHATYIKDVWVRDGVNDSKYKWEDVTFWNIGQQIEWFQNYCSSTQTYIINHITGWNLGTYESSPKEIIGNSDGLGKYNITLSNSIFSNQDLLNDQPSLMFTTQNPVDQTNIITLRNLVLYEVNEPQPRDGSLPIEITNWLSDSPQFKDPENGDFTVGNSAYITGGDNGEILGARYWNPNFLDNYSDLKSIMDFKCEIDSLFINGQLISNFSKTKLNYEYNLKSSDPFPKITCVNDSGSKVLIAFTEFDSLSSSFSAKIKVTSANNYNHKIYTIQFYVLSNIAYLRSLSIDSIPISGFDSLKTTYLIKLPFDSLRIPTIEFTLNYDSSNVVVKKATDLKGSLEERRAVITVVSEDLSDTIEYNIEFYIMSNDASLSSIKVDGSTIDDFNPEKFDYIFKIPVSTTDIPLVKYELSNDSAIAELIPTTSLDGVTLIKVTAEDTSYKREYTVDFELVQGTNQNYHQENLLFYPTIVKDEINIINTMGINSIEIVTVVGQTMLIKTGNEMETINVSGLKSGIYILRVKTDTRIICESFIKK